MLRALEGKYDHAYELVPATAKPLHLRNYSLSTLVFESWKTMPVHVSIVFGLFGKSDSRSLVDGICVVFQVQSGIFRVVSQKLKSAKMIPVGIELFLARGK